MSLSQNKKTILSISLFIVIFAILLVIATFFDLQISKILTKISLPEGQYITNDPFAATVEIFATIPAPLFIGIGFLFIFIYCKRFLTGKKSKALMILSMLLATVAFVYMISDIFKYLIRHITLNELSDTSGFYLYIVYLIFALPIEGFVYLLIKNTPDDVVKNMLKLTLVVVIVVALTTIIINLGVKNIFGRIRYRAMNMDRDDPNYGFAAYMRWYEIKGKWITKEEMEAMWSTHDAIKSFPSGHTASAGTTYALIILPTILNRKDDKKLNILMYVISILWTGICAIGRIAAGAHFMSDTLFGGTLSFVIVVLLKEFYIDKGEHIKALFKKESSFEKVVE